MLDFLQSLSIGESERREERAPDHHDREPSVKRSAIHGSFGQDRVLFHRLVQRYFVV
jgi:hypothetical protein